MLNRFLEVVEIDSDGCWVFPGTSKYRHFSFGGKTIDAHVFSYLAFVGDSIEPRMDVMHKCDKQHCVTPTCLSKGTRQANVDDAKRKRRQVHGTMFPQAKLDYAKAAEIRRLYASCLYTQRQLAALFDVDQSVISEVVTFKIWKPSQQRTRE